MIRRADALLIVVDLSNAPLSQMETVITQLEKMRVEIGEEGMEDEANKILTQKQALIAGNKIDMDSARANYLLLYNKYGERFPIVAISAKNGTGLEDLKLKVYQLLDIIRVYTKAPGEKADLTEPIVLKVGSTLEDAATAVHKDFRANLKYARIWGSGKHDGVMAKRDHILQDGDIIELHV
jgi:hypothetical protein